MSILSSVREGINVVCCKQSLVNVDIQRHEKTQKMGQRGPEKYKCLKGAVAPYALNSLVRERLRLSLGPHLKRYLGALGFRPGAS